jgi:hypothetical protein
MLSVSLCMTALCQLLNGRPDLHETGGVHHNIYAYLERDAPNLREYN